MKALGGIGRVTLEVAMQRCLARCDCKIVIGLCEMIEADRHIVRSLETRRRSELLVQALARIGKIIILDEPLARHHPRHMCIAEQRDAIGCHVQGFVDAFEHGFCGLSRQAIHQVEIDALDPGIAQSLDQMPHHAGALPAIDHRLHARVRKSERPGLRG